jgi:TFIIF-interacting CTD phosphatase-like protein
MHATRYSQIKANQEVLPKPLLILDLDETIIHTTNERIDTAWDFETTNFYVYIRPGLAKFIEAIQAH